VDHQSWLFLGFFYSFVRQCEGEVMKILNSCVLIILLLLQSLAIAQETDKGAAICNQITTGINIIIDWTQTLCMSAKGKQPGTYSFVVISSKPVFSAEASKKAWLLIAVAIAGDVLNKNSSIKTEELWLSDANLTKNRVTHIMPAGVAKSLQRRIKADQITLDVMYSEISQNLTRKTFSDKEWAQRK
jgi:hypothetical protein